MRGLVDALRADPRWRAGFERWHEVPARPAHTTPIPERVHPRIRALLEQRGFGSLYAHQARAIELAGLSS